MNGNEYESVPVFMIGMKIKCKLLATELINMQFVTPSKWKIKTVLRKR